MQRTTGNPGLKLEALLERVRHNHTVAEDTALRLVRITSTVAEERARTRDLIAEVRRSRQRLEAMRAGTLTTLAAQPTRPVLWYTPRGPDPLDAARERLHARYAATGDPAIREELLRSYDGFARSLALKFRHREVVDDLLQVARIGLLHAIDRFDPALGRPFPVFARITITGELKRHIRDRTWAMRVPRSLQEDYLEVMRAVDELTAEHSDSPSIEAIAARCDMSVERVVEAMELRVGQRALSIDVPAVPGAEQPAVELGREDIGFQQLENRELLASLLGRLPERDRRIIELRFIGELTQSEIAAQVGVSQMCVSRVLARTLGRLRLWARSAVN